MMKRGKLVELSDEGKLLIITDLHGNLNDYDRYLSIINKKDDWDYVVFTGDFIHGIEDDYNSINILESIKDNVGKNFFVLLGNHEWAHIVNKPVFKGSYNQRINFEAFLKKKFENNWEEKLKEYKSFFKALPVALRTKNKLIITHAGPPHGIGSIEDIINIADSPENSGTYLNLKLFELLWNRPEDYTKNDLDLFLKAVNCNFSIVGHTPVDGVKVVNDRQIIISSSYARGRKAYLDIDLSKEYSDVNDILESVNYLN